MPEPDRAALADAIIAVLKCDCYPGNDHVHKPYCATRLRSTVREWAAEVPDALDGTGGQ